MSAPAETPSPASSPSPPPSSRRQSRGFGTWGAELDAAPSADEARIEKQLSGEAMTARVRIGVIATGTVYFAFAPAPGELRWLSAGVLALAWVYGIAVLIAQPHRRFAPAAFAWVATALDLVFSCLWIVATGGFESRWYDLYFLGLAACAFRFGLVETALLGLTFAASYALLLAGMGELGTHEPLVAMRLMLILLMGVTCALLAGDTLSQIRLRGTFEGAAKAAETAEGKLRSIVREAPLPLLLLDGNGQIERWNARAEELLGPEIPKSLDEVLSRVPDEQQAASLARVLHGTSRVSESVAFQTPAGPRDLQVELSAYRDAAGGTKGVAVAFHDLTARANAEKERLLARMAAEEEERAKISRELQEEVGQILATVRLTLRLVARTPSAEKRGAQITEAREHVNRLVARVRNLSRDLHNSVLDDLGLQPALRGYLERFTERTGVVVDFRAQGIARRFGVELETAVFRIAQETLENAARHAGVRTVSLGVWAHDDVIYLSIDDEGAGFDPAGAGKGLAAVRDRAEVLGGSFTLETAPGEGTRVSVTLPIPQPPLDAGTRGSA